MSPRYRTGSLGGAPWGLRSRSAIAPNLLGIGSGCRRVGMPRDVVLDRLFGIDDATTPAEAREGRATADLAPTLQRPHRDAQDLGRLGFGEKNHKTVHDSNRRHRATEVQILRAC